MGGSCQVSRPVNNQLFTQAFGDGLSSTDALPSTTTHDVSPIKYAPKWMRRQARVSFGVKISSSDRRHRSTHSSLFLLQFGGKLVTVQSPSVPPTSESGPSSPTATGLRRRQVIIEQVVVDQTFVQAVQTFDAMLQAGTLLDYCDFQISSPATTQDEQILWRFIRASFENDPKNSYIELLGFRRDDILQRVELLTKEDKQGLPTEAMNGLHVGEHAKKKGSTAGKYLSLATLFGRSL